jgi:hypothetical protein
MVSNWERDMRAFFSRAELLCFPLLALAFCFWALLKTPCFIAGNDPTKKMRWNMKPTFFMVICQDWGTIFAENFLIPKSSVIICRILSLFIFSSSLITLTPNLRSERTKIRTYSIHICICPLRFWLLTSWDILHILLPFLEPPMPFKDTRFLHSVFTVNYC